MFKRFFNKALVIILALILAISSFASAIPFIARPEMNKVKTFEEFKKVFSSPETGGLVFIDGTIEIDEPFYIRDIFPEIIAMGCAAPKDEKTQNYIHIKKGGSLTIDVKDMQLMADGVLRFMVIEDGGELILKNGSFDNMNAVSKMVPVLVNEGGRVYVDSDFTLYEDHGSLFEGKGEVVREKPSIDPDEGSGGDENPEISIPGPNPPQNIAEEGEVVEVTEDKEVIIFFTLPLLNDSFDNITVEKSIDNGESWNVAAFYKKAGHKDDIYFSDDKTYFSTWNYPSENCSFLKYSESFEEVNDSALYRLKFTFTDADKESRYTKNISVEMPKSFEATGFIGTKDYGALDGNRGGGNQGESERYPSHNNDDDDDDRKNDKKESITPNKEGPPAFVVPSVPQIGPEISTVPSLPPAEASKPQAPKEEIKEEETSSSKEEIILEDEVPSTKEQSKPLESFLPQEKRKGNIPGYISALALTAAAVGLGFVLGRKKL